MSLNWISPHKNVQFFAPDAAATRHWNRLGISTRQVDPFCCTPSWNMPFYSVFLPTRHIIWGADAHNALMFVETVVSEQSVYLTPVEEHWLFGCPLLGKEAVSLLEAYIPVLQAHYAPLFPRIVISGIRPKGVLAQRLFRVLGERFTFYFHTHSTACTASLSGGVDGFLARRSANLRANLKKAATRAHTKGVYFERVLPVSQAQADQTYTRMLAVEQTSWKGLGKCGMGESPSKEFYDTMLHRLAVTRDARVIFARHAEHDIGFIFGAMAGRVYRGQQFSYNDAWKSGSIGSLLQLEQIKWLCEENAARYDMGPITGPRMGYKAHWTEGNDTAQTWILVKNQA